MAKKSFINQNGKIKKQTNLEKVKDERNISKLLSMENKFNDNNRSSFKSKQLKENQSNIILEFALPFISQKSNQMEQLKALEFAIIVWNITTLPSESLQKEISKLQNNIFDINDMKNLINRKHELFSEYDFYINDFNANFNENGDMYLSLGVSVKYDK
ncbi:MAG: hypothetical protein HW421_563 [Ignavibacteria bacterium]|nr:hypothetical protein [Ignavibacteria bacterium]